MADEQPRAALERLIAERGDDYASLSRLIGKNSAYIQQFIKRGVPRRLSEEDRGLLARYFGVDEALLGGRPEAPAVRAVAVGQARVARSADLLLVPRFAIRASAGPGAIAEVDEPAAPIGFDRCWLRAIVGGDITQLSTISVDGDSMSPTLSDGDEILVDRGDAADRLRDGIYVLRVDDALIVKRIALNPVGRRIDILSDNRDYADWRDCDPATISPIGRVVWAGRRVR